MTANPSRSAKHRIIRYGATLAILVVVAWLFWTALSENWSEVEKENVQFSWLMVLAVIAFAVAVPVSGLLWGRIINGMNPGSQVSRREAMVVHSASWLLKYVPGQVGSLLNKVLWGQKKGISRRLVVISFIYENVFLQLSSIIPSTVILLASLGLTVFESNWVTAVLPLTAVIPLMAVLDRRLFRWVLSLATRRILKQEMPHEYFLPTVSTMGYLLKFVGPRIFNGVGFVLVAASLMDVPPHAWLPLGAAYVLAGAIGILAVFVPSGLGVREAVIFIFALQYMSPAQAVLLTLLSRLLSTVADAVVALFYLPLRASVKVSPPEPSQAQS